MKHEIDLSGNYFDPEMREEFHTAFAKREASRIVKHIEYYKKTTILEKHVSTKYSDRVIASS